MSEIKKEVCGANYAAATVGNLSEFVGKAFLKDVLSLTAMEVSVGERSLPVRWCRSFTAINRMRNCMSC